VCKSAAAADGHVEPPSSADETLKLPTSAAAAHA
jgi:hypothetical protein